MTSTSDLPLTAPDPASAKTQAAYTRKAWRVLIASFLVFTVLLTSAGVGILSYRAQATSQRTGTYQIISGSQLLVQPPQQIGFKVSTSYTIAEGYTLQTPPDTRVRIALFDGSTVELSGGTRMKFEQMRSSQYLNRSATIILRQDAGRAIIDTSAAGLARANIAIRTSTGIVDARQPITRFRVLVLPSQGASTETMSVSVLEGLTVAVTGADQQVTVNNGQQTTVTAGLAPDSPTVKQRELVANGAFTFEAQDIGKPATHWQEIAPLADDGDNRGVAPGRAELVPDTVIRGQKATSLHLVRAGGNVDNNQVGLEQTFPFGETDEFDQVTLTADVKVVSHSLPAGGDIGSEYPLIILLRYEDSHGIPQPDKGWGFYAQNDVGNRTNNGTLIGEQTALNTWTPFRLELKTLRPAPYKLVGLQLYASGHDFDAYIANVSIIAK